ncbi:MAG: proline dehydrogenase family protein [Candidatus Sericytochromatia bacterium]|nr:proline dehydrogenase family protein [Candidatus Sericytochromatia bacterium]
MDPAIIKLLPNIFVKFFAKPYIGGESEDKVIRHAQEIYSSDRFLSTLDALGEDVKSNNDINTFVNIYLDLARKISKLDNFTDNYSRPSISLKPSCFVMVHKKEDGSLDKAKMDWIGCYENIYKICSYAKQQNIRVTVEMEDRYWTEFTLKTYFKLLDSGLDNVGTVLQTRLYRSLEDVKLFDNRSRVRLVIGIYNEPASDALTDKDKMKDLMIDFAKILFEKGTFVEFATHDERYLNRFFKEVVIPNKIPSDRFEIQMLLGVPKEKLQKDLMSGQYLDEMLGNDAKYYGNKKVSFRLYLPFAQTWDNALAYCKRRLIENPNIALYGIKNLFIR